MGGFNASNGCDQMTLKKRWVIGSATVALTMAVAAGAVCLQDKLSGNTGVTAIMTVKNNILGATQGRKRRIPRTKRRDCGSGFPKGNRCSGTAMGSHTAAGRHPAFRCRCRPDSGPTESGRGEAGRCAGFRASGRFTTAAACRSDRGENVPAATL